MGKCSLFMQVKKGQLRGKIRYLKKFFEQVQDNT